MKLVTHKSCESESVGLSEARNEVVYLHQLQGEMWIGKHGVLLLGDNESSLKLAMNPVIHHAQSIHASNIIPFGIGSRRVSSNCVRSTRVSMLLI